MKPDFSASIRLLKKDPYIGPLIKQYGPPDLTRYHGRISVFAALVRSIVYQQVSGHAARAIHGRFLSLFPNKRPTPAGILKLTDEEMRGAGLSRGKVLYMRDLAEKFEGKVIRHRSFSRMESTEIVEHLLQIKGIGEWTVHMLLIFTLYRLDVLPVGDLAIRKGFQKVYGLKEMPDKKKMEELAKPWRAHASIVSWYLWRTVDE